jgi:hypothetical protein
MTPCSRFRLALVGPLAALALVLAVGCSSGGDKSDAGGAGSGPGGAGGSGNTGGAPALAGPCGPADGVGHFSLQLVAATDDNVAYSQFGGNVADKVSPSKIQVEKTVSGSCRMLAQPTFSCSPACPGSGMECVAMNQCGAAPVRHGVGTISVTGLAAPLTAEPMGATKNYTGSLTNPFPPATVGAPITMSTAGGDYAPFALHGQGIDPLTFPAPTATIKDNQPFAFTWTAGTVAAARIIAELNFTHHGGAPAIAQCDLPDTGAGEFPAEIVHALLDNGTSGFPTLSVTRRVVDSTMADPGCVDFTVSAFIERPVMIDGLTSCNCNGADCTDPNNPDPIPCPTGHTCREKGSAGGLTCD